MKTFEIIIKFVEFLLVLIINSQIYLYPDHLQWLFSALTVSTIPPDATLIFDIELISME